jgi:hypothetical protein
MADEGVVAEGFALVEIGEVEPSCGPADSFSAEELAYARSKSIPSAPPRLAAKQAASRLLGLAGLGTSSWCGDKERHPAVFAGRRGPARRPRRVRTLVSDPRAQAGRGERAVLRDQDDRPRLALRLALLLALVAGAFGIYPASARRATFPAPFNHDRNAVWLTHRWLEAQAPRRSRRSSRGSIRGRHLRLSAPHPFG